MSTIRWTIKEDKYQWYERLAGRPRYSVVDQNGNAVCISSNKQYALDYLDCLNDGKILHDSSL